MTCLKQVTTFIRKIARNPYNKLNMCLLKFCTGIKATSTTHFFQMFLAIMYSNPVSKS